MAPFPTGFILHKGLRECWAFTGMKEFITICDGIFDRIGMPQRTTRPRTYFDTNQTKPSLIRPTENALYEEETALTEHDETYKNLSAETPTFVTKVLYRQNSDWQGTVKWVEKGLEVNFRSLLELVMLMSEAVGASSPGWKQANPLNLSKAAPGDSGK